MIPSDRRKRIVDAYVNLDLNSPLTDRCITFVKVTCKCRSISHFLDTAKGSNVERLEGMLNV
jgi:hypothetical protein